MIVLPSVNRIARLPAPGPLDLIHLFLYNPWAALENVLYVAIFFVLQVTPFVSR